MHQAGSRQRLSSIPKYDGFCLVPSHLNYQRVVNNFYDRYYPFEHEPRSGYQKQTLLFLNHIFGEQLDLRKVEAKGYDRQETKFFGKFVLYSNFETDFILMDQDEIRYWVRKLPVLKQPKADIVEKVLQSRMV